MTISGAHKLPLTRRGDAAAAAASAAAAATLIIRSTRTRKDIIPVNLWRYHVFASSHPRLGDEQVASLRAAASTGS